jgi:tetratricopeptide (TPR) repeat protein/type II secretory pathway pseudopilin PulG
MGEVIGEAERKPGRLVAVMTVLVTLAAAATGYMQATALREHAESAVRAERLAALAVDVAAGSNEQAQVQIERYRTLRQQQMQATHSTGRESARWTRIAQTTARDTRAIARTELIAAGCSAQTAECGGRPLPVICSPKLDGRDCGPGARFSPERDRSFPTRYEQAAQWEGYRLLGLREAANQQADAAEGRFAHLAAALTMLVVAVFLFGYSLTPQGRERRVLFSGVATAFALVGLAWAIFHGLRGTERPPESAAVAFADGEVALHEGDYGPAVAHLKRAIAAWPGAVTAYADLGQAQFIKNEGELSGVTSLPRRSSLEAAIGSDGRAMENGSESPTVSADKGGSLLFLGLLMHDDGRIREARALSADAAERFEGQRREGRHPGRYLVTTRFTIAEADLALGSARARGEYCEAIRTMLALAKEVPVEEMIVPAAHIDLRAIVHAHPRLNGIAAQIAGQVDRAAAGAKSYGCAGQPEG